MNKLDLDYQNLLKDILENGIKKQTRNGEVLSLFGRQIRHKMSDGFPLLTTKKMYMKGIITELLWFLRGDTNIKFLVDNNCHIWDGDAYKNYAKHQIKETRRQQHQMRQNGFDVTLDPNYLSKEEFIEKIKTDDEFAKKWGELGPIYGRQWRGWKKPNHLTGPCEDEFTTDLGFISKEEYKIQKDLYVIDQIQNLINELKTNPDSRRLMVNAWNVGELDQMVLQPCHYGFQVYTRELSLNDRVLEFANRDLDPSEFRRGGNYGTVIPQEKTLEVLDKHNIPTRAISLMWNQRSVDVGLGLPFNIASYALLLEIIAQEVNMVPDELIGNLGDTHLYINHVEPIKEQLTREPYPLPTLKINTEFWGTESGECGVGPLKTNLQGFEVSDFILENYQSHPTIKLPLSN